MKIKPVGIRIQVDEARALDMAANGEGHCTGKRNPANGMLREATDSNGHGNVTSAPFINDVPAWLARMDRTGDRMVTTVNFDRA
ncbi:MAG: hypothetical protein NXH94_05280 [Rhodobacteraceae bacterium]|nr:hypothetical protein [Paracoccaceae bacterium]